MRRRVRLGALAAVAIALLPAACSPSRMGINRMASALTDTARAYSTDNDPEFVRLAAPSTLKMVEMLLDQDPQHEGLLLTACSGFTQYAYAFLQVDAELAPPSEAARAEELRSRARSMYVRARGYCWRALEQAHPGARAAITADPQKGLAGDAGGRRAVALLAGGVVGRGARAREQPAAASDRPGGDPAGARARAGP